jgi:spermidine synthase
VSIRTNGKVDALLNLGPTDRRPVDESTMVLLGALPLLLHPTARTAANIGMAPG